MGKSKKEKQEKIKMNFIMDMGTYPFDIMISIGETNKEVRAALKKFERPYKKLNLKRKNLASTYDLGGPIFIRFNNYAENTKHDGVVSHELFHAIEFVFDRIGLPHSSDTSEAWAYQLDYLVKTFFDRYIDIRDNNIKK